MARQTSVGVSTADFSKTGSSKDDGIQTRYPASWRVGEGVCCWLCRIVSDTGSLVALVLGSVVGIRGSRAIAERSAAPAGQTIQMNAPTVNAPPAEPGSASQPESLATSTAAVTAPATSALDSAVESGVEAPDTEAADTETGLTKPILIVPMPPVPGAVLCPPFSSARPPEGDVEVVLVVSDVIENGQPNPDRQTAMLIHRTRDGSTSSSLTSSKDQSTEWLTIDGVTYHRRVRGGDFVVVANSRWATRSQPPSDATYRYPDFNVRAFARHETSDDFDNCHYEAEVGPINADDPSAPRTRWETMVNSAGELTEITEFPENKQFVHRYMFRTANAFPYPAPPCPRLEAGEQPKGDEPFLCGAPPATTTVPAGSDAGVDRT